MVMFFPASTLHARHVCAPFKLCSKSFLLLQVWKHSMMFWHTSMQGFFRSSFNSLGTIFVQTFHMPKSSVIIFQILFFFMSSLLVVIQTVNWWSPHTTCLNINISTDCWRLPTPGVAFHFLAFLFGPLVPLKNMCVGHGVISMHLLKHFKCLWRSFPPSRSKILGLFIALCLLFTPSCS